MVRVVFYLVRHAECVMNLSLPRFVGGRSTASPLTDKGLTQAHACAAALAAAAPTFSRALASPAVRTRDTARIILAGLGAAAQKPAAAEIDDNLQEIDQGEWEGKERASCVTPEVAAQRAADEAVFRAPGGESKLDVEGRMVGCLGAAAGAAGNGDCVLVVGHGVAIKCFLRWIVGGDHASSHEVVLANTGISRVVFDGEAGTERCPDSWAVLEVNQCQHVE